MARSKTPGHARFIEDVGITTEGDGLPRIAGRLFGYLLLSPGPRSLDEIAEALEVSKGSASTDARLLLRHGWLRRVSQTGDRKDYYELAPDFFAEIVAYRLRRWDALHDVVAAAIPELQDDRAAARSQLQYLERAQTFFGEGLRELLAEWRALASQSADSDAPEAPPQVVPQTTGSATTRG